MNRSCARTLSWLALGCGLAAALTSCGKNSRESVKAAPPPESFDEFRPTGKPKLASAEIINPATRARATWTFEVRNNEAIVEGDIVLGPAVSLERRGGGPLLELKKISRLGGFDILSLQFTATSLWPKGTVPYELPAAYPQRYVVLAAIDEFHSRTGIRFEARKNSDVNYLEFALLDADGVAGQSRLGMVGGHQLLLLNKDKKWIRGNVIHELCHALGIAHEQSRANREKFVRIDLTEVALGYDSQFKQLFDDGRDIGPYDYNSIMHYGPMVFAKGNKPTIIPLQDDVTIGQRVALSDGDITALNQIYAQEIARR
jgi:hypothetical protein